MSQTAQAAPTPDGAPTEPSVDEVTPKRRWRTGISGGYWFRLALVVLLLLPWVIGIGMERAGENRRITPFPEVDAEALTSTSTFRQADQALKDRLPMKTAVVRIVGELSVATGTSFTPRVVTGTDGTPFSADDFTKPCDAPVDTAKATESLERWQRATEANGGDAVFVIAPDKSSIERDRFGRFTDDLLACADANRDIMQEWADEDGSQVLALWDPISERSAFENDLYQRGDTHWTERGAAIMVGALLNRLAGPDSAIDFDADRVDGDWTERPGDLYALMGSDRTDNVPRVAVKRPGVKTERVTEPGTTFRGVRTETTTAPDADQLLPGTTLVIYDSFYDRAEGMLRGYYERAVTMHWSDLAKLTREGKPLPKADRVVFESVQRFMPDRLEVLNDERTTRALDKALGVDEDR